MPDKDIQDYEVKEELPQRERSRREMSRREAHRETLEIFHEISTLLNTGLSRSQLACSLSLTENGVNPEALANVIKSLRAQNPKEKTNFKASA